MKNNIFKGKSTRTKVFTLISVGVILALLGINYLLTFLGAKYSWYADLTPEELYTLSDEMKAECAYIDELDDGDKKLKITFCADPDTLTESTVTRVTYFMALQLAEEFDNIEVETVNSVYNPTELAQYRTTSLTKISPTDVIVSYGNTYRIVAANSFWTVTSEESYFSYNGEYKMATLLMSVTAVNRPVAYFTTGHGETYFDTADDNNPTNAEAEQLYYLLLERGLEVKTLDLSDESVEEVPEDCVLVIINDPKTDFLYNEASEGAFYYRSETDKLDRYLRKNQGAIMVSKDYATTLPNLENFLYEWGFDFSTDKVTDSTNNIGTPDKILGVYETKSDSYANAVYGEFAALHSAPHTVYSNTGYVSCSFYESESRMEDGASNIRIFYNSFMKSYTTAIAGTGAQIDKKDTALDLAAVTVRRDVDDKTSESEHSYVFCANSSEFFSNELLSNRAYANFDIVSALVNNVSRLDVYASMELGGTSVNSPKYGGKQLVYDVLSKTDTTIYNPDATVKGSKRAFSDGARNTAIVISVSVPVIALATGVVIRLRRKYL